MVGAGEGTTAENGAVKLAMVEGGYEVDEAGNSLVLLGDMRVAVRFPPPPPPVVPFWRL